MNIDQVLEDGIRLKERQWSAINEILRITKIIDKGEDFGYVDHLIGILKEIDLIVNKYPSADAPKKVYNHVIEQAKSNLPEAIYDLLLEYGKINKTQSPPLSKL